MEYEVLLLVFSVFLLLFDLFQLSRKKQKRHLNQGAYAAIAAFLLVLAAYGLLVVAFATDNFAFEEVYSYSSSSLSLLSKICSSWAGAGGSILFLSLMIMAVYFAFRIKLGSKISAKSNRAAQVLNVLAIFFVVMDIGKNAFVRLDTIPLDGAGLNPALQSPWMMVHPPIVFIGYAFILLAFALVLGGMKTNDLAETKLLKVSAGGAWLLMTIGIAMGGIWAYEVLGWGGYWSWDPVETGSLLVWLALTAYFFVHPLAEAGKSMAKEFTMLVAFVALIFLSALTRGGLLQSVHAYALSPAGPILIALAAGFLVYFFYLQRKANVPLLRLKIEKSSVRSVSLALGFGALALLFLGSFLGVAVPIIVPSLAPGSAFYNIWSFPFAALLVIAMIGYCLNDRLNLKMLTGIAVASFVAGSLLVAMSWPTANFLANMGFPLLAVALISILADLVLTAAKSNRSLKTFGRKLLFFGMVLGLFGILFSAAAKQTISVPTVYFNADGVATAQANDVSIVLRNWTLYKGEGQVYSPDLDSLASEHSSLRLNADIYRGDDVYHEYVWAYLYTSQINSGPLVRPLIVHTIQGDIYMHLESSNEIYNVLLQGLMGVENVQPQSASMTVSIVPMVYLLWVGVVFMCVGVGLYVLRDTKAKN